MFKDIVKASRSYRGYDESYRFSREELEDFVDCARFAPSSVNAQPFRYYLAWEKEEVDRIQKLTNWARALPQMQLPHPGMCPTGFIVICQDLNLGASIPRYQKDVGIVAQADAGDQRKKFLVAVIPRAGTAGPQNRGLYITCSGKHQNHSTNPT